VERGINEKESSCSARIAQAARQETGKSRTQGERQATGKVEGGVARGVCEHAVEAAGDAVYG
jgi:hypothetical protein